MKTLKILSLLIFLTTTSKIFGQNEIDIDVVYEPVNEDYFKGYKNAKMILDYYFTDGWSLHDRYTYEIIIVDDVLMVAFDSPKSDSFEKVSFQTKRKLSKDQMNEIKKAIESS